VSSNRGGAVVLGASGFVGTRLVRALARGDAAFVRAVDIAAPRERLDGVDYRALDVRAPLPAACGEGASVLYNLAAVHRTPGHPDRDYYDTNVHGALNATALAETCDIPTIVFTSSISVYGPSEEMLTEVSPLHPVSAYGRSKRMAEQVHDLWLQRAEGRRLVIIRPGIIFGPGEAGNYTRLARALRGGYFFYPGRRDTVKSGGYVDELLLAMDFALGCDERRVLFNYAYPELSSIADIVDTFGAVAGRRYSPPTLPIAPVLLCAALFEAAGAIGLKTSIHRDRIMKLVQSTKVAPAWLLQSGYRFSSDLAVALQRWSEETDGRFI
jgi:nucleoside-diphosphate-sugar epimerase